MNVQETRNKVKLGGVFEFRCFDKNGKLKWVDKAENLVVDNGLNFILDLLFAAEPGVDPWYVGLTDGTPTVASGDTMSSHSGWTEVTAYSEAARQTFSGSRTGQSVDNDASKASFSINADSTTIGGAFLTDASTKGGTGGTLLCAAAFTGGDKSADSGDTLEVKYTFTAADDGA